MVIKDRSVTVKRCYIMSKSIIKMPETSEHAIVLVFVVKNLDESLMYFSLCLFRKLFEWLFFRIKLSWLMLDIEKVIQ
jgi:hypothetical protein